MLRRTANVGVCIAGCLITSSATAQVDFYPMDTWPIEIVSADVNQDGLTDLITADGGTISIIMNEGGGSFAAPVHYWVNGDAWSVRTADLDGDLDQDLVAGVRKVGSRPEVVTLMNQGDGTFGDLVSYRLFDDCAIHVAPADFDHDGDVDVAAALSAATTNPAYWFENDGTGALVERHEISLASQGYLKTDLIADDFDDDGHIDLVIAAERGIYSGDNRFIFLFNEGNGQSWTRQSLVIPESDRRYDHLYDLAHGDIDGDGDLDFVFVRNDDPKGHQISLLFNQGNRLCEFGGTFQRDHCGLVELTDIEGDGDLDILTPRQILAGDVSLRIFLNVERGAVFDAVEFPIGVQFNEPPAFAVCDFTDDGQPDVVISRGRDVFGLWLFTNPFVRSGPLLEQGALNRGMNTTFEVSGADPDTQVYFLYSFSAPGNSRGVAYFGGITLDLVGEIFLIGHRRADAGGFAGMTRKVPANAPLIPLTTQAVAREGVGGRASEKTNFITEPILP